ncbi:rhodanese-like domain-containing protein [Plantactinospora sp. B6F1]|uniref:rhodanese-like domain-containing protein n=1 Tax=Plantactinospora sp. B6F1 TaxID=3158971 RepID=UPI00102C50B5
MPRGVPVHLICASGNRNVAVASYLTRAGVDARPVAGGTDARWRAGHPTVRGRHVSA